MTTFTKKPIFRSEVPMKRKMALLTGATGGIGRAVAVSYLSRGFDIFACDLDVDST